MYQKLLLVATIVFLFNAIDAQVFWNPLEQYPNTTGIGWPPKRGFNNNVLEWGYVHLEQIKTSAYRSTRGTPANMYGVILGAASRSISLFSDCVYDAWVATSCSFNKPVSGINLNPKKRSFSNKQIVEAVSYAAYTSLMENFGFLGENFQTNINSTLVKQGYSLDYVTNTNLYQASGIGVRACQLVIEKYLNDGTNSRGTDPNGNPPGQRYADWTNYRPPQDPMPYLARTDCDTLKYIDSWQPARVRSAVGANTTTVRLWADVVFTNAKPFAMPCNSYFRPGPVPKNITTTRQAWLDRNEKMLNYSFNLGDWEKAIANYYQGSEGYIGIIWTKFSILAAQIKNLSLENSIKLLFVNSHSTYEAYLFQYEGKRFYNPARPNSPIQCIYRNTFVDAWKGPYQGVGVINGSNWLAYIPDTQVSNPHPEFPCGHCSQSGAAGASFKRFFRSDKFIGESVVYNPGTFPQEPKLTNGMFGYIANVTDVPNTGKGTVGYAPGRHVKLSWKTWSEVTYQASMSRIYLGVHYEDSHNITYPIGRKVGDFVVDFIEKNYFKMPYLPRISEDETQSTEEDSTPTTKSETQSETESTENGTQSTEEDFGSTEGRTESTQTRTERT